MADLSKNDFFAFNAFQLYQNGELYKAIEICEKGLRDSPTFPQAHYILGKCYREKDQIDQARNEFERVLFYDQNHLTAMKALSEIYKSQGLDDVHDDYLFKLNTLDPLTNEISEQVQKTKIYNNWKTVLPGEKTDDQETQQSDTNITEEVEAATEVNFEAPVTEEKSGNVEEFNSILEGIFDGSEKELTEEQDNDDFMLMDTDNIGDQLITQEEDFLDTDIDSGLPEEESQTTELPEEPKTAEQITEEEKKQEVPAAAEPEAEKEKQTPVQEDTDDKRHIQDMVEGYENVFNGKIVSRTLGEILISQQKYSEAKKVFEILKKQHADNKYLDKKIEIIDQLISASNE